MSETKSYKKLDFSKPVRFTYDYLSIIEEAAQKLKKLNVSFPCCAEDRIGYNYLFKCKIKNFNCYVELNGIGMDGAEIVIKLKNNVNDMLVFAFNVYITSEYEFDPCKGNYFDGYEPKESTIGTKHMNNFLKLLNSMYNERNMTTIKAIKS